MFLKIRVIDGEYILKISRGIVTHVYKIALLSCVKVRHRIPLIEKKIRYNMSKVCAHRNPHYVVDIPCLQIAHICFCFSRGKEKLHIAQRLCESYFLLLKTSFANYRRTFLTVC